MAKHLTFLGAIPLAALPAVGFGHPLDPLVSEIQHAAEHAVLIALAGAFVSGVIYAVRWRLRRGR